MQREEYLARYRKKHIAVLIFDVLIMMLMSSLGLEWMPFQITGTILLILLTTGYFIYIGKKKNKDFKLRCSNCYSYGIYHEIENKIVRTTHHAYESHYEHEAIVYCNECGTTFPAKYSDIIRDVGDID